MRTRAMHPTVAAGAAFFVSLAFAGPAPGEEAAAPKYVGVKACGSCHKSEATGNQVGAWEKSAHARAFATLDSKQAHEIAKSLGLAEPPQQSSRCLRCHTTAAGTSKARMADGFDRTLGVQCETCHGAGEHYAKIQHMISGAKSRQAGLLEPNAKLCRSCHNSDSPTSQAFDFAAAVKAIAHPLAKK